MYQTVIRVHDLLAAKPALTTRSKPDSDICDRVTAYDEKPFRKAIARRRQ